MPTSGPSSTSSCGAAEWRLKGCNEISESGTGIHRTFRIIATASSSAIAPRGIWQVESLIAPVALYCSARKYCTELLNLGMLAFTHLQLSTVQYCTLVYWCTVPNNEPVPLSDPQFKCKAEARQPSTVWHWQVHARLVALSRAS